ncbi:hypothetical protein [Cohnella zeiphila]|uniref:Uncharacterized protein n=1 Tax=Cohnella zeiphila TaxID=2761120 RepID=A0A7X0SKX4_9BACL|nr:hypothetical protein [Cohnella zeiphila]MBB6731877.1 hypothetical protein [Cohnella zeiphila]
MIRNKTIKFNLDKPEERELWVWLSKLPHGEFSTETKEQWRQVMLWQKEKEEHK